jgi:LysR family glycine cleavage system transcriptional activator
MSNLPLNALRAFAVAAAAGGVRPASRRMGISHSAISRHIGELEAWIGVPLLDRRAGERSLQLTAAGQRLAHAAQAALRDLEAIVEAVREVRSPFAVTVSTTASVASRWLLPRLPDLARMHPRVQLSVLVDPRPADPGDSGADLGLRMGEGPWPGVWAEPLMDDLLYPVMGARAWEAAGRPSRLEQLRHLPLLHDRDPAAGWERWRRAFGPVDLDLKPGSRFASSDLVLRAAAQGLGVALARHRLAIDDVASGLLVRPFGTDAVALPEAYWLVTPEGPLRAAVRTVFAWLKTAAAVDRPRTG